jgi:hypothetical protein
MAAITADGRQELVALYLTMFGNAPSTQKLAEMVVARENGSTLAQVAATLATDSSFALVASKDADSFATYLADALLAADIPAAARTWAINWVVTQVSGTKSKSQVIAEAVQAIRATTNTNYTTSKAELTAEVTSSLETIDNGQVFTGTFVLTNNDDVADTVSASRGSLSSPFKFTNGNEVVNASVGALEATDILLDEATTDNDVLNAKLAGASGAFTATNIETINADFAAGAPNLELGAVDGVKNINVSGAVAGTVSGFAADTTTATIGTSNYTNTLTVMPATLAGTSTLGTAETVNLSVSGASFGATANAQSVVAIDGTNGAGTLETLNLTSAGSAANTVSLTATNGAALGTVNLLGSQDLTVRMTHAGVTGVTIAGAANTANTTLLIDRNGAANTPTSLANVTGVDKIAFRDSTAGTDGFAVSSVVDGATLEAVSSFTGGTNSVTVTGAAAATANKLTLSLDHATADTSVTLSSVNIQDVETVNVISSGNSGAAIGAGNAITLTGDATTLTITGDTAITVTANIDTATSGNRTTTVSAAGLTGTAAISFTAAGDTNTTNLYTVTGSALSDTLVGGAGSNNITGGEGNDAITGGASNDTISGGAGNDSITTTNGTDQITLGDGIDTLTVAATVSNTTATAQVTSAATIATDLDATEYVAVTIGGVTYTTVFATDDATTLTNFVNSHAPAIGAANSVTVTSTATGLVFTGKADGTAFTAPTVNVVTAGGVATAQTVTTTTTGIVAGVGDNVVSDFGTTDIISLANLTLGGGGYYEGTAAALTAATDYTVIVLTDSSYASANDAQTAIDAILTSTSNADAIVVYLDSAVGYARAYYTDDAADNGGENVFIDFANVTTLSGVASTFSNASFGLS